MNHSTVSVLALCLALGCAPPSDAQSAGREPIVGLPCDGCEAVFEGLPTQLGFASHIAPPGEPGEAMRIQGTVRDPQGRPKGGVIVYAYHTNAQGIYPKDEHAKGEAAARHGRLRGWARTDPSGRYQFDTIRPGGYPNRDAPQHVHMHVIEVGRCAYYIDSIMFADDPRLTPEKRRELASGRGGNGIVDPRRDETRRWLVTRDIVLGQGIPGYPTESPNALAARPRSGCCRRGSWGRDS
jgi:protocatechuate 3,4-dioxygenase beta subunit